MNYKFLIFILVFIQGCVLKKNLNLSDLENTQSYKNLTTTYLSCSGKGEIQSTDSYLGKLTFHYMSQRDSSFIQFKDILGRKFLLIWLTNDDFIAWNILENKKYNYSQLLKVFPVLNDIIPNDITKILWGIKPDNTSGRFSYRYNSKSLSDNNIFITSATVSNNKSNQSILIDINNRIHNLKSVDLNSAWKLIQS
tara:strand:+ start:2351 stop:2935 length:585 start_codon:yes stop_codon:yes gene_type:complete